MGQDAGRGWRRIAGVLLALAAVGTAVLTLWAVLQAPPRTLIELRRVGSGTTIDLPEQRPSSRWWRVHLQIDPHLRPGPPWILHAGDPEQPGHSLHWRPDRLSLHLLRREAPAAGPLPTPELLVATIPLRRAPDRLSWSRRDHRHHLEIDGIERGAWEDALVAPGTRRWTLVPHGDLGVAQLAVDDDIHLQREAEHSIPREEILDAAATRRLVRAALATLPETERGMLARETAAKALTVIGSSSPAGRELAPWLAWDRARSALATNPELPTLPLADAVDRLASDPLDPAPGLGLLLVPALGWRATRAPLAPVPARTWIQQRREWLLTTARAADVRTSIVGLDWELALIAHLARVLAGEQPQPTPTDAPSWVTTRWRLAAAMPLPANDGASQPEVPPLTAPGRPSIRATTQTLLAHSRLSQIEAARLRAEVLSALAQTQPDAALTALRSGPPRERILVRALLACHGVGPVEQARIALAADSGSGGTWREIDPLAYALDRLLAHRSGERSPPQLATEPGTPSRLEAELPPTLGPFRRLLSGKAVATTLVFAYGDANLPPLHALAAALALQEVAGSEPDWALLDEAPCLDLPLHLMRPPADAPDSAP